MSFTKEETKTVFPLDFGAAEFNKNQEDWCDRIFNKLVTAVGGLDNLVFSPPSTEDLFNNTGKYWETLFNEDGKITGITTAFFVKDISKVSEEYKSQVEVLQCEI